MKSENKNFIYNAIYQLLSFIFPLITIPYISRVLGVTSIGIYSYTYSIVYLFMLLGMLGINNHGNRLIAKARDDKELLSKTFFSIYGFQIITCLSVIVIYVLYLLLFNSTYKMESILQIIFLVSVSFDVNWFFAGLEKFKITILRNLVVRLVSLVLVITLVRTKNDLPIYIIIMGGSELVGKFSLFVFLPRYISFYRVSIADIMSNTKEVFKLFIPVLAFGIYKVMDKTMIGILSSVSEVGLYENAEKLMNLPLAVITALGTAMLPRMAYVCSKDRVKYKKIIGNSMCIAIKLSVIMCMGLLLTANDAVVVIFGEQFKDSGLIAILLSVTLLASSWANVIRTQLLIPLGKDDIYISSTIGAAILNFGFNCIK